MYREAFDWVLSITPGYDKDTKIVLVSKYAEDSHELCILVLSVTMKNSPEEAENALIVSEKPELADFKLQVSSPRPGICRNVIFFLFRG